MGLTNTYSKYSLFAQIKETGQKTKLLLEKEAQPSVIQLAECLADWYKVAQIQYIQAQILDRDIDTYNLRLSEITNEVSDIDLSFHKGMITMPRVICDATSKQGGCLKAQDLKKHRTILDDIRTTFGRSQF